MKDKLSIAIQLIALLTLLVGFFMAVAGWSQIIKGSYHSSEYMPTAIAGTIMFVNSFVLFGLAYIVEASSIYIKKNKEQTK